MIAHPRLRRGVTLVELMIAMLILAIVCISWLEIIGIQSAKREARRREAVERLAGMMDAFMYVYKDGEDVEGNYLEPSFYREVLNGSRLSFEVADANTVYPLFDQEDSSIGYQLRVIEKYELQGLLGWSNSHLQTWGPYYWLVGFLYDSNGGVEDVGNPYFVLPTYMGYDQDH